MKQPPAVMREQTLARISTEHLSLLPVGKTDAEQN